MGDLRDIARWFVSSPSGEDMHRFTKIAGSIKDIVEAGKQIADPLAVPASLGIGAIAGLSEYRKQKALFNPRVQEARNAYYGD